MRQPHYVAVEKSHGEWLASARAAGPALLSGMNYKLTKKEAIASLVSRTKDAEKTMVRRCRLNTSG